MVDGLSQDRTIKIVKEYEPLFQNRLKWVSEKDSGLYDAMNKGIRMATGDIIGKLIQMIFTSEMMSLRK